MSTTRDQIAAHLNRHFSHLAAEINQIARSDTADGYGPDIDRALRALGNAEADIATAAIADASIVAGLALADYFALDRFARQLSTKVDTRAYATEGNRDRIFDNVIALRELARETVEDAGYSIGGAGGASAWGLTNLSLDYIEPEPTV